MLLLPSTLIFSSFVYSFTNGFGSSSFRNSSRVNLLHTPVQLPAGNQMNYVSRLNNSYQQNSGNYNYKAQNGNCHHMDVGGSHGNYNNGNSHTGGGNGGSGEQVSCGVGLNDAPSLNLGGGKLYSHKFRLVSDYDMTTIRLENVNCISV